MMMETDSNFRPDIIELLAGNALGDLDPIEARKLAEQLAEEDKQNADELQRAVGVLQLAFASQNSMAMPSALRDKITSEAPKYLKRTVLAEPVRPVVSGTAATSITRREKLAWLVTAASILVAIGLWASGKQSSLSPGVAMSPSQARAELLAQASDRIEIAWTEGTTPFDLVVSGDVVWSNSLQKGFLRFVGMPINDRSLQQYQLWIIDPLRDDKPIDGGVFDITGEGEVIIPIDAKLAVIDPAAFAVTIEKPGGVVVSDQKRLPLLAKVADTKG
jgi:anti-sigma-K factor RskA